MKVARLHVRASRKGREHGAGKICKFGFIGSQTTVACDAPFVSDFNAWVKRECWRGCASLASRVKFHRYQVLFGVVFHVGHVAHSLSVIGFLEFNSNGLAPVQHRPVALASYAHERG